MATIGLDVDGVCFDFVGAVADYADKDRPKADKWHFFEEWGWNRKRFCKECRSYVRISGGLFWSGYRIDGAFAGVRALLEAGHRVVFVTARNGFGDSSLDYVVARRTRDWIEWVFGIPDPIVHFSAQKDEAARLFNIDYFLDDKPENVEALRKVGVKAYLFDQPWNRDHLTMRRVGSWEEFVAVVAADESPLLAAATETRTVSATGGEKGVKPERYDLLPKPALDALARVYSYGATKYADHNWRRGYEWSKSYAAAMRHLTAFWNGETHDPESGLPHVAHAMFHMAALLTWLETDGEGGQFDDRYRKTEEDAA